MKSFPVVHNWNQIRAFMHTAETGSFSEGARQLDLTQSTLSRQVAALEAALNVTLFERVGKRLRITVAGRDLLVHVRKMADAADALILNANAHHQSIEGIVSISASDAFSAYFLPGIISEIRRDAPDLCINVISSNEISDLLRREADIAVRHIRPTQPDLIATLVRETSTGFFATLTYLEYNGWPQTIADLSNHQFIGYAPIDRFIETLIGIGAAVDQSNFKLCTNNGVTMREMALAHLGICFMPKEFAANETQLVSLIPEATELRPPIWLVTHRELHTSQKIRFVFDRMVEAIKRGP